MSLNAPTEAKTLAKSHGQQIEYWRAFIQQLKNLPDDFLRLPQDFNTHAQQQYPELPQNVGQDLTRNLSTSISKHASQQSEGQNILDITVVEANLVKNYGFLRMDCYCRVRVGHNVCETQTCLNGAKNPRWNGVFHFYLQPGIDSFHLEIFDEKQFSADEKIAWMHHEIPRELYQGRTVESWFPLSGRLGEDREGSILLVMSLKKVPQRSAGGGRIAVGTMRHQAHHSAVNQHPQQPVMIVPAAQVAHGAPVLTTVPPQPGPQIPIYVQPNPPPVQGVLAQAAQQIQGQSLSTELTTSQPISQSDIDQLHEMFPNVDKDVIKSILGDNLGDKNSTISALLSLNDRSS